MRDVLGVMVWFVPLRLVILILSADRVFSCFRVLLGWCLWESVGFL
jgi:hypothetical protein